MKLTNPEKLFLKIVRRLEQSQEPFTYRRVCDEAGWKSLQQAWRAREGLISKGYLEIGTRLALVECPVITNSGLAAIKRAA